MSSGGLFIWCLLGYYTVVMHTEPSSKFETAIFEWIAASSPDAALRSQLASAQVAKRECTGAGCYSQIVTAQGVSPTREPYGSRGPLGGPDFESPAVEHGGGTLLWFQNGLANCLEIYVHGKYFPSDHEELGEFRLLKGAK
jgi:hypothetical protein